MAARRVGTFFATIGRRAGAPASLSCRSDPRSGGHGVLLSHQPRCERVLLPSTATPSEGAGRCPARARAHVGIALRESVARRADPGLSLPLLPRQALPHDLAWAGTSPRVADALARWNGAIYAAGAAHATSQARERLRRAIMSWSGEDPPLGMRWLDEALDGMDDSERPWAELALSGEEDRGMAQLGSRSDGRRIRHLDCRRRPLELTRSDRFRDERTDDVSVSGGRG